MDNILLLLFYDVTLRPLCIYKITNTHSVSKWE